MNPYPTRPMFSCFIRRMLIREAEGDLHEARIVRLRFGDAAEQRRGDRRVRVVPLHVVEGVEHLQADLEVRAPAGPHGLEERHVEDERLAAVDPFETGTCGVERVLGADAERGLLGLARASLPRS